MIAEAIGSFRSASADPGDIFTVAAPAIGAAQPAPTPIMDGDASVSTQTGAFEYSYPIQVPPGRHGMQPHLALSYSSQAPIYGGIATGWTLSIPIITQDTTNGRMVQVATGTKQYQSSMAGNRPLVAVTELTGPDTVQTYRAQNDSSYTRYERLSGSANVWWRAYGTDGTTYLFGEVKNLGACTHVSDAYAPLTSQTDQFGNTVNYIYSSAISGECRIARITWGENTSASLPSLNSITFNYNATPSVCDGIQVNSQSSYRTGVKVVTGASELDSLTIVAAPGGTTVHTRTITLIYQAPKNSGKPETRSCNLTYAPYRTLYQIQESASGVSSPLVTLPPVEFTYGNAALPWSSYPETAQGRLPWAAGPHAANQHSPYTLSWGYRYPEVKAPTLEAMMIDIDGDGLVDRLTSTPILDAQSHVVQCRAQWEPNTGNLNFGAARYIQMPTLKWDGDSVYAAGPYAGYNTTDSNPNGQYEGCSLNYQQTAYMNSSPASQNTCPGDPNPNMCVSGHCSNGSDCNKTPLGSVGTSTLSFRWIDLDGDGLVDLVASPSQGGLANYNYIQGTGIGAYGIPPAEPATFGPLTMWTTSSWPGPHGCPSPSYSGDTSGAYTMCNGMYPWIFYKNMGNGVFGTSASTALPTAIIYEPIALETTQGDSSINSQPVGEYQAFTDLDGDGYPDGVFGGHSPGWVVYRNDGTGVLKPATSTAPFNFPTTAIDPLDLVLPNDLGANEPGEVAGLFDLNGDGLQDYWTLPFPGVNQFVINDGASTESFSATTNVPPSTGANSIVLTNDGPPNFVPVTGSRIDSTRVLDMDGDGRLDVLTRSQFVTSGTGTVNFNEGGQFPVTGVALGDAVAMEHNIVVDDVNGVSGTTVWEERSNMLDLDGDGIPEGINFDLNSADIGAGTFDLSRIPTPTAPPRLMTGVDNHRGATTTIAYAVTTNAAVVTQNPATRKALPHPDWVVQSTTTADTFAHTTSTTSYIYKDPEYLLDPTRNQWGFRGFDEVDATEPSTSQVIQRYSYAPDWSGRLTTTIVQAHSTTVPADNGPVTIDDTGWQAFTLFAGALTTYHTVTKDHWTCPANGTEASCRAFTANHRRDVSTLTSLDSTTSGNTTPLLWAETEADQIASTTSGVFADGDRRILTTYRLHADGTTYRFRKITGLKQVSASSVWQTYAQGAATWDSTDRVQLTDESWVDTVAANRAITRYVYDMATGNVTQRWKPVQNAANTVAANFTYDSNKLFKTADIDELGHEIDYTYEPGTGKRLTATGPNVATCSPSCPNGTLPKEQHAIKIDGIGRTIERDETYSDDGSAYTSYPVELFTYTDPANPDATTYVATTVTHQSAIDGTGGAVSRYTKDMTVVDGHGRPTTKTVYSLGAAPYDQISSFVYGNDGTLTSVAMPDPSKNDASTVLYTYGYDSIGRATSMRRPDSTTLANQSGTNMSYDGLTATATEVVGIAGGQIGTTKSYKDRFDHLIEIDEQTAASTFAVTKYTYTADDNVHTIVDPQSVTTTLTHDFAGRRTQIARVSGTWTYTYDKNGNIISELPPCSPSPACNATYTTTMAYDALDRPQSKMVAPRALSSADITLFGSGLESFTWDVGPNQIGRLSSWASFGPGASTATVTTAPTYNAQGQDMSLKDTLTVSGYPTLTRQYLENHDLRGAVRDVYYLDVVGTTYCQNGGLSETNYDARGLPTSIELVECLYVGTTPYNDVVDTRNVAGLVTKRYSAAGSGTISYAESNWTYDPLGRVTSQVVNATPSLTLAARQDLVYFGNDDPKSMDQYLATNHKHFNYTYDLRHQLLGAVESTTTGYFSGAYTFGTGGRLASANESALSSPGSTVLPRNVNYQYGGTDPEQVTKLVNVSGGATYAAYAYDTQGNESVRCIGGPTTACTGAELDYVYDGKNQLRRVTSKTNGVLQKTEEYWYDGNGTRTAIVKKDNNGFKTEMVWFIGPTEAHYDAVGNVSFVYAYVSDGTAVARMNRTAASLPEVEWEFHGLATSTLATIDQSGGSINASFSYAPFGEIIEDTNLGGATEGVPAHSRRMNDKYVDDASGLAYYGARYYDPTSMTWTQTDPFYRLVPDVSKSSTPRRADLYAFSLNNPETYLDPDGRDSKAGPQLSSYVSEAEGMDTARRARGGDDDWNSMLDAESRESSGYPTLGHFDDSPIIGNPSNSWCDGVTSVCENGDDEPSTQTQIIGAVKLFGAFQLASAGVAACTSLIGCAVGIPAIAIAADVGGSSVTEIVTARKATTVVGMIGGNAAQQIEEAASTGIGLAYGVGRLTIAQAVSLVTVSRWGKQGSLDPGDWVMKGGATRWNYLMSGKMQSWGSNQYAPFSQSQTFQVMSNTLSSPDETASLNWIKSVIGQRKYDP